MIMSQQCAPVAKKANSFMGCARKSITRKQRKMVFTFYSSLMRHLECWVQFWGPQYMSGMDILEQVQRKVMKICKGLEHLI